MDAAGRIPPAPAQGERCALLALDGVSPGIGKSTLATALAGWAAGHGRRVELFCEEDILSHPAFSAVARDFRSDGRVAPEVLLAATGRYIEALDSAGVQVAVLDALLPFLPSLLAWGYSDSMTAEFVRRLTAVVSSRALVLVYVDGSADLALARARSREGPQWFQWLVGRYRGVAGSPPVTDEESLLVHLRRRRELTLHLVRDNGWEVVVLDADGRSAEQLRVAAIRALGHLLPGGP